MYVYILKRQRIEEKKCRSLMGYACAQCLSEIKLCLYICGCSSFVFVLVSFKSNETLIQQFVEFKWIDQGHVIYRNEGFIK